MQFTPTVKSSIKALTIALSILAAYTAQPYRPFIVRGDSMAPTYEDWQFLVADRRVPGKLTRHDVVLIKVNGELMLKRIAYVEGDYYLQIFTPQGPFDIVALKPGDGGKRRTLAKVVPAGHVYVIGDNFTFSRDSRQFGTVPVKDIVAVVPHAPQPDEHYAVAEPYTVDEVRQMGARSAQKETPTLLSHAWEKTYPLVQ